MYKYENCDGYYSLNLRNDTVKCMKFWKIDGRRHQKQILTIKILPRYVLKYITVGYKLKFLEYNDF